MTFSLLRYSGRDCVILGAYRYGKQSGCGDLEISQTTFDSSSFNIRHLETFSDFKPGVFYGLKLIRPLKMRTSGHGGLGFETLGYIYLCSYWQLS